MKKWDIRVFVLTEEHEAKFQVAAVVFSGPEKTGTGFGPHDPKACCVKLDTARLGPVPQGEYPGEIRDDFGVNGVISITVDGQERLWPSKMLYPQYQRFASESLERAIIEAAIAMFDSPKQGVGALKQAVRAYEGK